MLLSLVVIESTLHTRHRPPPSVWSHVETPARQEAAAAALRAAPFAARLDFRAAGVGVTHDAAASSLLAVHDAEHLQAVRRLSTRGGGFDADTYCAPGSWEAMLDASAAWTEALELAARAEGPALALARPPGHHATRGTAMGFCLVNFAAAAAAAVLGSDPNARVAILDWDVHHGNGVAEMVAELGPRVRYCSTHERGGFPRTGLDETARGTHGNLLHLPLPTGSSGEAYLRRLRDEALPFLLAAEEGGEGGAHWPTVLLICAGYDALAADELAGLGLTPEDFATSIDVIVKEFGYPAEKLALGLEGGYCLDQQVGMPAGLRSTVGALVEG